MGRLFSMFFLLGIFYYISISFSSGKNIYFSYILTGLAYSAIIRTALFHTVNMLETEQVTGTLGYLFTTPHSIIEYLLGINASGFILSWLEAAIYITAGITIFKTPYHISFPILLLIVLTVLLSSFSLWGLGIISASVTLYTKKGNSFSWLLTALVIFSGDVFFPHNLLPGWLNWISKYNPATYTLSILRNLLTGNIQAISINYSYLLLLVFFALSFILVGYLSFQLALTWVKKKGTLEHF